MSDDTRAAGGITAHIMLPDGSTVGEWAAPQLQQVYGGGQMPALMPGGSR